MIRAALTLLIALVLAGALCACDGDQAPPEPAPELVNVAQSGPVTLRVESDRDTIRTVDRAAVRIGVTLEPGATLTDLSVDAEAAGWTVIDDRQEPERLIGQGRTRLSRTLTLEPFLEGEYEIPSVHAAWSMADASGVVTSEPMRVRVTSVLEADDPLTIGEVRPIPPETIEAAQRSGAPTLVAILGGVGAAALLATALIWRRSRRAAPDPASVILARLERAAQAGEPGVEACAEAAEALRLLAGDRVDGSARSLIDRLDDARFAPASDADRIADLVRDAAALGRSLIEARRARA